MSPLERFIVLHLFPRPNFFLFPTPHYSCFNISCLLPLPPTRPIFPELLYSSCPSPSPTRLSLSAKSSRPTPGLSTRVARNICEPYLASQSPAPIWMESGNWSSTVVVLSSHSSLYIVWLWTLEEEEEKNCLKSAADRSWHTLYPLFKHRGKNRLCCIGDSTVRSVFGANVVG